MARSATSLIVLALGAFAATGLAACGEEDAKLLPGETAREITANLATIKQLADEGDCVGAESATEQVGEQVEALGEVDPALKRTLEEGTARLDVVVAGCEEVTEAIAPADIPTTSEEAADERGEQKDEEKRAKEEERERDKENAEEPSEKETPPPLPPQANGEGKGLGEETGSEPGAEEEDTSPPSGGVSPGSEVGEGE